MTALQREGGGGGGMTSWDVKVLCWAAAVRLCHLLSQREQEKQREDGQCCPVVSSEVVCSGIR